LSGLFELFFADFHRKKSEPRKPDPCGNAHRKGRQAQNNCIKTAVFVSIIPNNLNKNGSLMPNRKIKVILKFLSKH
jgi:hypothetical protein